MSFSVKNLPWERNDGGRRAAGYKGSTRDCVIRAIAIATGNPYKEVYKAIYDIAKAKPIWRQAWNPKTCSPRFGVYHEHYQEYLEQRGWKYMLARDLAPDGAKVTSDNLALAGTVVIRVHGHLMTVIDGVVQDNFSPSRLRKHIVMGAFVKVD